MQALYIFLTPHVMLLFKKVYLSTKLTTLKHWRIVRAVAPVAVTSPSPSPTKSVVRLPAFCQVQEYLCAQRFREQAVQEEGRTHLCTAPMRHQGSTHLPHRAQSHLKWDLAIQQTVFISFDSNQTQWVSLEFHGRILHLKALRGSWDYCALKPEETWNQAFQAAATHRTHQSCVSCHAGPILQELQLHTAAILLHS